ncbi:endo-1,4-beta-xylanase [Alkalicoccobacillus gibsonii]|uniref:endo-1,4-beta-xylanase n=1 Tax=Alkalicoccobacillus gibsonii TaxID=79881 RepID=UPI003F7BD193
MSQILNEYTPSLCNLFAKNFYIGAAVTPFTIKQQEELITTHFNSITAENEMKFVSVHPSEDEYTFEKADTLMAFAKENDMHVRGHTLIWHNQTSDWIFENKDGSTPTRDQLLTRMKTHIHKVMGRYKGEIYAWDVVNEAISDKEDEFLRPSKWLEIIGEDFIAKAFEFAREADPHAQLFYNDYNEVNPIKRDKIFKLVQSLKEQGVPIDGIGLQGHWSIYGPSIDLIREAMKKYASLGVRLHVTELDLSVFDHEDKRTDLTKPTNEMLSLQAERYRDIFQLFLEHRTHLESVTFWGAADDYTWLDHFPVRGRKNWPFLFDENHLPKQSFHEIVKLLQKS